MPRQVPSNASGEPQGIGVFLSDSPFVLLMVGILASEMGITEAIEVHS